MLSSEQEILFEEFAKSSDELFRLNITSTDSFTGEIGEFIACKYFNLKKSNRVAKSVDGICILGNRYQIKSKVISGNNFNYNINRIDQRSFDFLVVVYLNKHYNPVKILKIAANKIFNNRISITSKLLTSGIEIIDGSEVNLNTSEKTAIHTFSSAFNRLLDNNLIRSRRIVGDIGEFYACKELGLEISNNQNEKGIDARDKYGNTYEIKTRRVYESGRRLSKTRRLNNLVGKSAKYLIVVTIDWCFKCSGMWIIPMENLSNPKSANLRVVNTTFGTKNIIPSKISWLRTGEKLEFLK